MYSVRSFDRQVVLMFASFQFVVSVLITYVYVYISLVL